MTTAKEDTVDHLAIALSSYKKHFIKYQDSLNHQSYDLEHRKTLFEMARGGLKQALDNYIDMRVIQLLRMAISVERYDLR